MLVLARHSGEVIRVGSDIRVIINTIQRSRVLIGIEAPIDIAIDRKEIYLRKQQERRSMPEFATEPSREEIETMPAPGILGRLAQRFRTRAGTYTADARRGPSQHEASDPTDRNGLNAGVGRVRSRGTGGKVSSTRQPPRLAKLS